MTKLALLLALIVLPVGFSIGQIDTTVAKRQHLWVGAFHTYYQLGVAAGISGQPWREDVTWALGVKYMLPWPYGPNSSFFGGYYRPYYAIHRLGLLVQRSQNWPKQWRNIGSDFTLLQTYTSEPIPLESHYLRLAVLPGLHYTHTWHNLRLKGYVMFGPGLAFGSSVWVVGQPPQYQFDGYLSGGFGLLLAWPRKVQQ